MSDERKCFAGDLISDAIGKTVRVPFKDGTISSVIEDVLVGVVHESVLRRQDPTRGAHEGIRPPLSVVEEQTSSPSAQFHTATLCRPAADRGLTVPDETEVTVSDERLADRMTVDPIGEWPGTLTRNRQRSNFSATWGTTLQLLDREVWYLGGKNMRLQVAIPASQFRLDGKPRATAKAEHPGVILTLDSKHGPLSYPCDTFTTWQDNVRAIALALEALRKVDRYGVTKRGEQYRGFLALEATAMPGFSTYADALAFLADVGGISAESDRSALVRIAKRAAHPDTGGDAATFHRVTLAEAKLREEGLL
jgi:hypothetical protein